MMSTYSSKSEAISLLKPKTRLIGFASGLFFTFFILEILAKKFASAQLISFSFQPSDVSEVALLMGAVAAFTIYSLLSENEINETTNDNQTTVE